MIQENTEKQKGMISVLLLLNKYKKKTIVEEHLTG